MQTSTDTSTTLPIEQRETLARWMWTGLIIGFFVIQAILWTVAILFTANDQSHAVVSGYDEQAVSWDEQRRLVQQSDALAWTVQWNIEPTGNIHRERALTVTLQDASGQAIQDAKVTLQAFHCGRAAEVQNVSLLHTADGVYAGSVIIDKDGHWQFQGQAIRQDDVFLLEQRQFLKR